MGGQDGAAGGYVRYYSMMEEEDAYIANRELKIVSQNV